MNNMRYICVSIKSHFFPPQIMTIRNGLWDVLIRFCFRTEARSHSVAGNTARRRPNSFRIALSPCPRSRFFPQAICRQWPSGQYLWQRLGFLAWTQENSVRPSSFRVFHGVGWGLHPGCIAAHLLLPSQLFPSPSFHGHYFQQHSSINSQHANLTSETTREGTQPETLVKIYQSIKYYVAL